MTMTKKGKTMTPVPTETTVPIKKVYKFFNDNLELTTKEVSVTFTPTSSVADAMSRLGNNEALVLEALNSQLKKLAVSSARKEALSGGISKKVVLNTIKPFRDLPPWSGMVVEGMSTEEKRAAKRKQTETLLEVIKAQPVLLAALKAASAEQTDDEDDDETGADE